MYQLDENHYTRLYNNSNVIKLNINSERSKKFVVKTHFAIFDFSIGVHAQ